MRINEEVREQLVSAMREHLLNFEKLISSYLDEMEKANSVEEIMNLKKRILVLWTESLPLGTRHCYFCFLYDRCTDCPYGRIHGICGPGKKSDYGRIREAEDHLLGSLERYFRAEEKYQEATDESG